MIQVDLAGRVALVTGASRGIGAAIARRLASAGAHVILNYHRSADAAEALLAALRADGHRAEAVGADVADVAAVEAMFERLQKEHGRLDVLVNNAGVVKDGLLVSTSEAAWRKVMSVNLDGVFRCTRTALRSMMRARCGRVVNVASVSAVRGGRGQANYAAAKGAVLAFTRACALEVADRGIQVNAVLPGFIETDMTEALKRRAGDRVLERIPAGRFGTPDDVASLVLFLCSDDASYITGQGFCVDGGMSVA